MSDLITLHCPNCGKQLQFRSTVETLFCTHCGTKLQYQNGGLVKFHAEQVIAPPAAPVAPGQTPGANIPPRPPSTNKVKPKHQVRNRVLAVVTCFLAVLTLPYIVVPGIPEGVAIFLGIFGGLCLAGFISILLARRHIWFPVVTIVLTALSFYLVPVSQYRLALVIPFGILASIATLVLLGVIIARISRHARVVGLAIGLVLILIVEAITGLGLNAYADSKTTVTVAAVQNYYTELAVLVAEGDELAKGYHPSGMTYEDIYKEARNVDGEMMGWTDIPGELVDYVKKVDAWANNISSAATTAAEIKNSGGNPAWNAPMPPDFQLSMPSSQLDAAELTANDEIINQISYGDYAFETGNGDALLLIAARLNAESYWLKGISISTDPSWINDHFHFVEPLIIVKSDTEMSSIPNLTSPGWFNRVSNSILPLAYSFAVGSIGGVRGRASSLEVFAGRASTAAFWGSQKYVQCCPKNMECGGCFPSKNGIYYDGALTQATKYDTPENAWDGNKDAFPGPPDPFPPPPAPTSENAPPGPENPPLDFTNYCKAKGGQVWPTEGPGAVHPNRLPPGVQGWVCYRSNDPCWEMLAYSYSTYAGGDPGCPEKGLMPDPNGPLGHAVGKIGGVLGQVPGINIQPVIPIWSWDGTYTIEKVSANCPGLNQYINAGASATGKTFVVVNNSLQGGPNGYIAIGSDGKAEYSATANSGPVSVTVTVVYQFTQTANGGASFTSTFSASGAIQCSGTSEGVRTSQ